MIIRKLNIKNFGKVHDKTLEFSPGINVLYGENESGKTTIHTFIKSMLFGLTRTVKTMTTVCPEIFRKIMFWQSC